MLPFREVRLGTAGVARVAPAPERQAHPIEGLRFTGAGNGPKFATAADAMDVDGDRTRPAHVRGGAGQGRVVNRARMRVL
jgi:hypothetical protein